MSSLADGTSESGSCPRPHRTFRLFPLLLFGMSAMVLLCSRFWSVPSPLCRHDMDSFQKLGWAKPTNFASGGPVSGRRAARSRGTLRLCWTSQFLRGQDKLCSRWWHPGSRGSRPFVQREHFRWPAMNAEAECRTNPHVPETSTIFCIKHRIGANRNSRAGHIRSITFACIIV